MTRKIQFRAWDLNKELMCTVTELFFDNAGNPTHVEVIRQNDSGTGFDKVLIPNGDDLELMQFTGLKDNSVMHTEVYEGDILDVNGIIIGNLYEPPQVHTGGVDCVIAGMGTNAWRESESVAMGRGCEYAE